MKTFEELIQRFYEWTLEVNYDSNLTNNSKYIWEIPDAALEKWKHSLDNYEDQFTEHTLAIHRDMFHVGGRITGILVGCTSDDTYARLHKLTQLEVPWYFEEILCHGDINILEQNGISADITLSTGKSVTLPIVINAHTMKTDNDFDLVDSRLDTKGLCLGEGYKIYSSSTVSASDISSTPRDHNRLDQESWLATIDYVTGDFHLVRSHIENEKKFKLYYEELVKILGGLYTRRVTSATGLSTSVPTYNYMPDASLIKPYEYVSPTGTIEVLTGPGEVMFEWDITSPEIEEDKLDTIDTMVSNIQDSIASGELSSPEPLTSDDAQRLYDTLVNSENSENESENSENDAE